MSLLEIIGAAALWLAGTYVLCLVAAFIGSRFGKGQEDAVAHMVAGVNAVLDHPSAPAPEKHGAPIGWATVRVEDTCDGLMINADDMKRLGLQYDVHYEGHFLPDGRYLIAIPSPAPAKHVDVFNDANLTKEIADFLLHRDQQTTQDERDQDERETSAFMIVQMVGRRLRALATTEGSDNG